MSTEVTPVTIKVVYEDGVLKPRGPLPLKEHAEVEIEIKGTGESGLGPDDPRSFVGFIKGAPKDVSLARDHDQYLDK
jgi:predicted DNA-binding antitoxin AbrB/MazE fold protein